MDPSQDESDLSIVRVLERAWHVEAIRDCPAPGGEPLWRVSSRPREFRLNTNPAETCKIRRLPRVTPAVRSSTAECKRVGTAGKIIALDYSREPPVVTFLVELNPETNIARSSATCQSGSPPRVGNKNAFSTGHTFRGRRSGPVWFILRRIHLWLFLPSFRPFAVKECRRADKLSAVFLRAVWFVDRDAKRSFVGGRIHRSRRSVPPWCEPATRYRLTWLPGDLES